jgi:hypothetical protein
MNATLTIITDDLPVNAEATHCGIPAHELRFHHQEGTKMYRTSTTKSGKYRVAAICTGLPKGAIGSGGKSFATKEERDAAVEESCKILQGLEGWRIVRR